MRNIVTAILISLFVSNCLYSQQWFNKITDEVGISEAKGFRVWLTDINNDDYPDLVWGGDVGALYNHIYVYLNIPNPDKNSRLKRIFKDFTAESGLQVSRIDSIESRIVDIAAFADLDNDGDLDVVTSIYGHRVQNYKSTGDRTEVMLNDGQGHFTLVDNHGLANFNYASNLELGQTNTTGLSFLDYDLDGNIDLYLGTWFADYKGTSADIHMGNFLFKGNGDGTFQKGQQLGFAEALYGTNVTDWNNDGWQDIVNSPYCRTTGQFFKNVNGQMIEASAEANYNIQRLGGDHGQNLCQWEANPADFDNDGDMDLLEVKVHGGYNPGEGRTTITINTGENNGYKLEWDLDRIRRKAPIESHLGDQGGTWFDMNNDGLQDIALGQNSYPQANVFGQERLYLLLQNSDGYFDEVLPSTTLLDTIKEAHSMEPADFDMDGDQDLFLSRNAYDTVTENGQTKVIKYTRIDLIENIIGEQNNFVQVKLAKNDTVKGANAAYIGAKVIVHTCQFTLKQEIQSGLGHFAGMQPFIKTFGLGNQTAIDSIEIIYPNKDQSRVVLYGPPANTLIEVGNTIKYIDYRNDDSRILSTAGAGTFDFGTVNVNETKTSQFQIKNLSELSDSNIQIDSIKVIDAQGIFSLGNISFPQNICCYDSVLSIPINFSPTIRHEYHATALIFNNSNNAPIMAVCLKGNGFEPKPIMALSTKSIKFDNVWVDSSTSATITLENRGELDLDISSLTISGATDVFSLSDQAPMTIKPGESKEITAYFTPNEKNTFNGAINISSNAYNQDTTSIINLAGVCDGPNSKIATDAKFVISFGDVLLNDKKDIPLNITNEGEGELIISSIQFDNPAFSSSVSQFPLRIKESKEITLSFSPTQIGDYSTDMVINSDAVNTPVYTKRAIGKGVTKSNVELWADGKMLLSFKIAPNPVKNSGNLLVEAHSNNLTNISAELYDMTGRLVKPLFSNKNISGAGTINLDVHGVTAGTYYIKIFSDKESSTTIPIIIEN
jgi:hypothetical protein